MYPMSYTADAQSAQLAFVRSEAARVNATIYQIRYPESRYRGLVPVDTSLPEWMDSIVFMSVDGAGRAEFLNVGSDDVPLVAVTQDQTEAFVHAAGIGYDYNLEEVGKAQALNIPLTARKAEIARRGAEQMIDRLIWAGDAQKGITGVINNPNVPVVNAAASGTGSSTKWKDKTPGQMLQDVNALLSGIWTGTARTAVADTLALPASAYVYAASTMLPDGGGRTLLQWLEQTNLYTTGSRQPLDIVALPELDTAGAGGVSRSVAYRNSPSSVVAHMPMPFRFFPTYQKGPFSYHTPGLFRMGGVEFLLPKEATYLDGL